MALLISCWFIIESIIIPHGSRKWFYLSFYIHPIFLFFCQIFLWIKLLQRWLILIVSLPIRIISFLVLYILRFLRGFVVFLFSFTRVTNAEVVEEVNQFEEQQFSNEIQVVHSYSCSNRASIVLHELKISEFQVTQSIEDTPNKEDEVLHMEEHDDLHSSEDISMEYFSSNHSSNSSEEDVNMIGYVSSVCSSNSPIEDVHTSVYLPSVCSSTSPPMERAISDDHEQEELDSFYNKYTERMRWFDVLNYDRTCGISAILNKQYLGTPSSLQSIETVDFSIPYISWTKLARKKLLRSLESDFEMVYVAQSCLSWEALHHQYQKVEALIACSNSTQIGVFYNNVAGEFQKFQVLLERFMEDERCYPTKRYWNYVQRRLSQNSLLQVPEISGYMEEEKDEMNGEPMRATEVLKAIEKCIEVFRLFVKTDNERPWWKVRRSSLWTHSPVEDPRDLGLLVDLSKTLQKKELWLKDMQRKKKCWLKRVTDPCGETQKKEILITMIDMKLVSRVLKMSMISTAQLKWCQEKLNSIEFKEGKFMRASTGPLFPSS
ncbi:uncharacterized protein LOC132315918 [Cornus florida]|uniref:uncharacterized protein LOC132315918 n=1 Tax=Cornus florida TaxID=4283 RepID=UPI0028A14D2A|nr:uncharacterized protein LOC132315918 [Cornus florida]